MNLRGSNAYIYEKEVYILNYAKAYLDRAQHLIQVRNWLLWFEVSICIRKDLH